MRPSTAVAEIQPATKIRRVTAWHHAVRRGYLFVVVFLVGQAHPWGCL